YLLLRCQPVPGQHGLLQGRAVGESAGPLVYCRGPARIDVDFVIVSHHTRVAAQLRGCLPFRPNVDPPATTAKIKAAAPPSARRSRRSPPTEAAMLKRIDLFVAESPTKSWDGAWRLEQK